jgi:hypothetical protein
VIVAETDVLTHCLAGDMRQEVFGGRVLEHPASCDQDAGLFISGVPTLHTSVLRACQAPRRSAVAVREARQQLLPAVCSPPEEQPLWGLWLRLRG